jgi:hypothetical protein
MQYTRGIIVIYHILKENLITLYRFPHYIPNSQGGFLFWQIFATWQHKEKPNVTHTKDFYETKLPKLLNLEKKKIGLKLPYLDNRF